MPCWRSGRPVTFSHVMFMLQGCTGHSKTASNCCAHGPLAVHRRPPTVIHLPTARLLSDMTLASQQLSVRASHLHNSSAGLVRGDTVHDRWAGKAGQGGSWT